jgi:hypothetical protein
MRSNKTEDIYPQITQIQGKRLLVMSEMQQVSTAEVDCEELEKRQASRKAAKAQR